MTGFSGRLPSLVRKFETNKGHKALLFTVLVIPALSACTEIDRCEPPDDHLSVAQVFQNAVNDGYSGTALVRHRGEILLNKAAGMADRERAIPNKTDTVFLLGSITKQFTGALILTLQEAGLLHVNDTLAEHFDALPQDKASITIHELLTHTAGFPANLAGDYDPVGREAYLELAWSTPLVSEPGAAFNYSNSGYSIAAAIAEKVTGQSYEVALSERVFIPANLDETGYVLPDWSDRTLARGYRGSQSVEAIRSPWAEDGPYWNLRGNGGLLTTTSDLLKWHDALEGEGVLGAGSIEALQGRHVRLDPRREYYGYGWFTADTPAGSMHWHGGSNRFHFAQMVRFVDEDLLVILLANEADKSSLCLPWNLARASSSALQNWASPID